MTRTPQVGGPVGATAVTEPIWQVAYPGYFTITLVYGLFAALKPIVALQGAPGSGPADATGAQLFGLLVTAASLLGFTGSVRTVTRRRDGAEMIGTAAFTVMMLVYFTALTVLIATHDPNTRPGSSFVPLGFAWFPAIRYVIIVRDRRHRRRTATT